MGTGTDNDNGTDTDTDKDTDTDTDKDTDTDTDNDNGNGNDNDNGNDTGTNTGTGTDPGTGTCNDNDNDNCRQPVADLGSLPPPPCGGPGFVMPHPDTLASSPSCDLMNTPRHGKFKPIVEGTGFGYDRSPLQEGRIHAALDTAADAKGSYKMMGMPRNQIQGIVFVRKALQYHLANMAPGKRLAQMAKDGCKKVVSRILFAASKFFMFLLKDMGCCIGSIYDTAQFIHMVDRQTVHAFSLKLEAMGYAASSMKQIEYQLHLFFIALAGSAEAGGMPTGNLSSLASHLNKAANSRGRAAKLEARQRFTRENQKKKLGITGDPSINMLWSAFMQCYQRIKVLMDKMFDPQHNYGGEEEHSSTGSGGDDEPYAADCFLSLTPKEHMELMALYAVVLSMMYGGARVSMLRVLKPCWLVMRHGTCKLDPSVHQEQLKRYSWSSLANTDIHTQVGQLLYNYISLFRVMVEDEMPGFNFDDDFTVFFQIDDPAFIKKFQEIHDHCTSPGDGAGVMSRLDVQKELVELIMNTRPVSDHFMHFSLRAVFVDWLQMFKDINQTVFRHLLAWMNYELWYTQCELDFCGMPNRFLNSSYHQFLEQASADANNTPEVFERTYCPEGMSKLTQQEEQELADGQADLDQAAITPPTTTTDDDDDGDDGDGGDGGDDDGGGGDGEEVDPVQKQKLKRLQECLFDDDDYDDDDEKELDPELQQKLKRLGKRPQKRRRTR